MFWRRNLFGESLTGHARFVVRLSESAARYFKSPSEAGAFAVSQAAGIERENHRIAVSVLKALVHPLREESLRLLRLLHESAVETAWAVEEAARFESASNADLAEMAASIEQAGAALEAALPLLSRRQLCEQRLIEVKRLTAEAERLHRSARLQGLAATNVVSGLKTTAVAKRLSQAADSLSESAEVLAGLLPAEAA